MSLIPEDKKELLRNDFKAKLADPVKILMFTQEIECRFCSETRKIAQEMPSLSDKISTQVYDFIADIEKVKQYNIKRIPALAILGKKDYGVRIYGVPYGYELQTLIEAIVNVSKGTTNLSEKTRTVLKDVNAPVHIQVFVSLTCPHCPGAAAIAHKLAVECNNISADVIDGGEFPELTQKYEVIGVPKIVINEKVEFMGEFNEDLFAEHVVLGALQ